MLIVKLEGACTPTAQFVLNVPLTFVFLLLLFLVHLNYLVLLVELGFLAVIIFL